MVKDLPTGHVGTLSRACVSCGEVKSPEHFSIHKHKGHSSGYIALPRCKPCHKTYKIHSHINRTYGISPLEFDSLLESQGGVCALCGRSGSGEDLKRLVVDHCHKTKKVRGLLCWPCNIGLGMFRDNPELLLKAKTYLA